MQDPLDLAERAARVVRERIVGSPRVAVVLGSGLGGLVDSLERAVSIPFTDLPGLPRTSVVGHGGRYVAGRLAGLDVLLQAGRVHAYEGCSPDEVVAPVRIAAALGVETLLLTNAAGGIHPGLSPGDLLLLQDQIDFSFRPLPTAPLRPGTIRAPEVQTPFDADLAGTISAAARATGIDLPVGTYAGLHGPSFETPAEVRMLAKIGADVVGMSTVAEVVTARALGLRVAALSLVTNRATGLAPEPLSHDEVLAVGRESGARLERLLREVLTRLGGADQSAGAK